MKKIITFLSIILLVNTCLLAQTKTASKLGTKGPAALDSLMCSKEWHIASIEEWAVVSKPTEKTKNDMIKLSLDGKYNLVLFGNAKSGTWTRSGKYIYFVNEATKEKFHYKIVNVDANKFKVDFLDPDEMHSIFEMEGK